MIKARMADPIAPKEKKTDSAVTRYSLPEGRFSSSSVPSVGIEPCETSCWSGNQDLTCTSKLTPTAVPSKNRLRHSIGKDLENAERKPKVDVKNSVPLNAALRPIKSEPRERVGISCGTVKLVSPTSAPSNGSDHHTSKQ